MSLELWLLVLLVALVVNEVRSILIIRRLRKELALIELKMDDQGKDFINFLGRLHEPRINESLQRAYERGLVQEKVKSWSG